MIQSEKDGVRAASRPVRREALEAFLDRELEKPSNEDDERYSGDLSVLGHRPFAPAAALARHCLLEAIPRSLLTRLLAGEPVVLVVETPGASWVDPIGSALASILGRRDHDVLRVHRPPTVSAAKATEQRIVQRPLIGVAPDRSFLPRSVVAAADAVIRPRASAAAVSRTFRALYRRSARLCQRDLAGLDFEDIVLAIRPNSTPRECVERMRRAARGLVAAVDGAPGLNELAGGGEALDALKAIAADLARVSDGRLKGEALPSILLFGLPGVGKTTLARSLARTAGLPLVACSVGDWFSGGNAHLGAVIASIRIFFETAIAASPCIAFIDELDAVPDRATLDERGRDWWTPVVTTLLVSIDRARARGSGIVLVGATNHIDRLDSALKRPGRFDKHFEVFNLQGEADVAAALRHHLGSDLPDADLSALALVGARGNVSAATVKEWARGARERARRRGAELAMEDLVAMVTPADRRPDGLRRLIALHEAGHAIVGRVLGCSVAAVTIVPNSETDGLASLFHEETVATREEIERRVIIALGGRAADEILGTGATASAASDLRYATHVLSSLHGSLGLGDRLTARPPADLSPYDFELLRVVETELQRLMAQARTLVRTHAGAITALAETLLVLPVAVEADVDAALTHAAEPVLDGCGG